MIIQQDATIQVATGEKLYRMWDLSYSITDFPRQTWQYQI